MLATLVEWLLRFCCRATPPLLLVEDLHWGAHPTTLAFLGSLVAARPAPPGHAARHEPVSTSLVTPWSTLVGGSSSSARSLRTTPRSLVAAMLPDLDLPPEQRVIIVERGTRVPLFLQELAGNAGSPVTTRGITATPSATSCSPARVLGAGVPRPPPGAARGRVRCRVQCRAAARARGRADRGQCRTASPGRPASSSRSADARQHTYRFQRPLLRDAADQTQVLEARALPMHHRIAPLLESSAPSTPGDLAIVARHHDLAGDPGAGDTGLHDRRAGRAGRGQPQRGSAGSSTVHWSCWPRDAETGERELAELPPRTLRTVSVSSLYGYGFPDVLADFDSVPMQASAGDTATGPRYLPACTSASGATCWCAATRYRGERLCFSTP